ncbi:phage tail protein [Pyramidobacter sp. CG50-2]|uniref:phage tail protein n=1 Tax=Pyramidobacter sp. CG50-2 TaxID=2382160 RepID=UPI000EA15633|nr:phage tail protein [Pyramidobacter sp. CG50-2]RKJ78798.1 tail fiber protein [Pyramidobacter sp. CG50-2]
MATVELITKNAQGALVRTVVGLPVGAVFWTAAKTPPPHSLAADGAAVSRTTYAELFAAIGTTWGEGDGSTTFALPDARWRAPWGSDSLHVGTYYSAGLPNITGSASWIVAGGYSSPSGALLWRTPHFNHRALLSTETADSNADLEFDASKSNSIYGGSNTVQPPALCLLPCIVYE